MKKLFDFFICMSLLVFSCCAQENLEEKKDGEIKAEKKEKEVKPVSDEAALAEQVVTGVFIGAIFAWVARKFERSWPTSGLIGTVAGGATFALDAKYGFFPKKTRSALMKIGFQILQGKVSDPELLDKVRQLSQECAIAFVKELLKTYGADGAQEALGKLKDEVKKGGGYFKAVRDKPLPKRGRIFSAKINFDELKNGEEKITAVLEKIEQAEQVVNFKTRFDAANRYMRSHTFCDGHAVVRGKFNLKQNKKEPLEEEEVKKVRAELVREKKSLPFACIEKEDFEQFLNNCTSALRKPKIEK